jgi:hypothetical protein
MCSSNPQRHLSPSLAALCTLLLHTLDTFNLIVATKRQLNQLSETLRCSLSGAFNSASRFTTIQSLSTNSRRHDQSLSAKRSIHVEHSDHDEHGRHAWWRQGGELAPTASFLWRLVCCFTRVLITGISRRCRHVLTMMFYAGYGRQR